MKRNRTEKDTFRKYIGTLTGGKYPYQYLSIVIPDTISDRMYYSFLRHLIKTINKKIFNLRVGILISIWLNVLIPLNPVFVGVYNYVLRYGLKSLFLIIQFL